MKKKIKWFIVCLVISLSTQTLLGKVNDEPSPDKDALVGRWITKSISGDALFFVISQIEGRMDKNGDFTGIVTFTDYETASRKGHYDVKGEYIYIYTKGTKKPYKLLYKFKDENKRVLKVTDEEFGVSITLKK